MRYRNGRYHRLERIQFLLDDASSYLEYPSFYPAFRDATRCIQPGATIEVELDGDAGNILALRCDGTSIAGAADVAVARRENGRSAMYLGIAFLAITAVSVVWFLTSPPVRRPRNAKARQKRRRARSSHGA